ncbi:hypothetical protein [Henriciella marina]|uniref:hypothetical protein n=1 Tax=Henriciella marina TaxID=453851 RepID=UPI0003684FD2|nr:hypothetical protein [Henriciella marina]
MKTFAMFAGLLTLAAIPAACTTAANSDYAGSAASGQTVAITPAIKAEIRRQGHDPDEEICRREEQMGSTIPKNVCATRAAWAAKTQASQDGARSIQQRGLQTRDPLAGG